MKITGEWITRTVKVNGRKLSPKLSQHVVNHSPDGFAWGYGGSGPMQLALAILLKGYCERRLAVELHAQFKREFIEPLEQRDFEIIVNVSEWVDRQMRARANLLQ